MNTTIFNKPFYSLLALLLIAVTGSAQTLTLEQCYQLARENYPLTKQRGLIEKSAAYSIQNINKSYWPQISLKGKANYQSAVTEIPVHLPNIDIPSLSKDQYKVYAEINQVIYDGGAIKAQKAARKIEAKAQQQRLEVELYQLKERINHLYFGILMLKSQIQQNQLFQKDIQVGLKELHAAVVHGVALKSSADLLKVRLLEVTQNAVQLTANRKAYLQMLGQFIHQALDSTTHLQIPKIPDIPTAIKRPKLLLFSYQSDQIAVQNQFLNAQVRPKFSLFLRGGYGRPGLNMLSNEFESYYIGGLQMTLPLSGFYTRKKERELLNIQQRKLALQKKTFLFNLHQKISAHQAEIAKWENLLSRDEEIIALRASIKNTALHQLEHGTITSKNYLDKVTALHQARIKKDLHKLKKRFAQYKLQTIK